MSFRLTTNIMALFVFCIFIVFSVRIFAFHQHDYHLIFERFNLTFVNKSYVNNTKIKLYYVTRYSKSCNISFDLIQDVDAHLLTFLIDGRKFQSNEYRLFPFNFSENVCYGFSNFKFGNIYEKWDTNFIPNCLVKKGHYYFNNIKYDDSKFPPYAPRGRYLLKSKLIYKKTILLTDADTYIEIKPQNPLERVVGV